MFADLRIGVDVGSAKPLMANRSLSNRGVIPHGEGMTIDQAQAVALGLGILDGLERRLRPYRNGRDLTQSSRDMRVIDLHGMTSQEVLNQYPTVYQWLVERVKPERDQSNDKDLKAKWWLHRRNNEDLRRSVEGLPRFIATVQTSKHRLFVFLEAEILPDDKLIAIASDDGLLLGMLSAQIHLVWALAAGATLEDRPVYNKSTCFDCFPFPEATGGLAINIRFLGERLDSHRRKQQAAFPGLTLTGMYNVLDKLRSGEPLTVKDRTIHEHGVVSVLRQLHDELDAAMLDAYGWSDLLPLLRIAHGNDSAVEGQTRDEARRAFDEAILERLVALNAERAAEESRGLVRWLRPEFQNPQSQQAPDQAQLDAGPAEEGDDAEATAVAVGKPQAWPKDAVAQVRAVADVLTASPASLSLDDIAARFTARGPWKKRLPQLLDMLVALGRAREIDGRYSAGA